MRAGRERMDTSPPDWPDPRDPGDPGADVSTTPTARSASRTTGADTRTDTALARRAAAPAQAADDRAIKRPRLTTGLPGSGGGTSGSGVGRRMERAPSGALTASGSQASGTSRPRGDELATSSSRHTGHRPSTAPDLQRGLALRPTQAQEEQFWARFHRAHRPTADETRLLRLSSTVVAPRDCQALLVIVERPAADFMDDVVRFADLVRVVQHLRASAEAFELSHRTIARLEEKAQECAQAFYALRGRMRIDESHLATLASLGNLWSHAEPLQGAGCVAVARIFEHMHQRSGPNLLLNRLKDNGVPPGRDLSLLINAFAQLPDEDACLNGAEAVAAVLLCDQDRLLVAEDYQPQALARVLNGVGKWPDAEACQQAADAVSEALWQRRDELREASGFRPLELTLCLNGLSKFSSPAVEQAVHAIAEVLLVRKDELSDPAAFPPKALALVINGMSKFPGVEKARDALDAAAAALVHRRKEVLDGHSFNPQDLSLGLNGVTRLVDRPACAKASRILAEALPVRRNSRGDLPGFLPQHLQLCLNGLSKSPEEESSRRAAATVAQALWYRRRDLDDPRQFDSHDLSGLLNGLSKWPRDESCRRTARRVFEALLRHRRDWSDDRLFNAQDVSNLVNAAAQWPEETLCAEVAAEAARALLRRNSALEDPRQFQPQHLLTLLNGLSKWPDNEDCHLAASAVTQALLDRWPAMAREGTLTSVDMALALNGAGKWTQDGFRRLAVTVAETLRLRTSSLTDPARFPVRHLSILLNSLGKWMEEPACRQALLAIAVALKQQLEQPRETSQLDTLGVVNSLNGLSKSPEEEACRAVAPLLAEMLLNRWDAEEDGPTLAHEQWASLINSVSRWTEMAACQRVALTVMEAIGAAGLPFAGFALGHLAQLANGIGRFIPDAQEDPDPVQDAIATLAPTRLRELASHLDSRPDRLAEADTRNLSVIFKAFAGAGLKDCLRLLGGQGLERLGVLQAQTDFKSDSLETLGTVAAGFLPLVRAPELRKHRAEALRQLDRMQPIVDRKIRLHTETPPSTQPPGSPSAPPPAMAEGEALGSRRPGLSFFLLLKTYAVVASQWKRSNLPELCVPASTRRAELTAWVEQTLARTRATIEADLDESSWNLIAQIEAGDQLLDALDLTLRKNLDRIVAAHPPTPLDVAAVRQELRGLREVRDLLGTGTGAATRQIIDLQGRVLRAAEVGEAAEAQYSFFTRLTGGQLPLLEVQLPGHVSAFMLSRAIRHGDDLLRMDVFGGSHLKPHRARSHELLAAESVRKAEVKRYGRLPAVRLADTAPDAPFMKDVIRKLNPQREDWFRMQRALLETVPRDHVVEGPIRLGLQADRPEGAPIAFALSAPDGTPILLASNDGCGFIRQSLARKIPVIRQGLDAQATPEAQRTDEQRRLLEGSHRLSPLPPQATHHFPRDEEAIEEARQHLRRALRSDPEAGGARSADDAPRLLSRQKLHEALVAAAITGAQGTAVPSADHRLHLPATKSQVFDAAGGAVLLGKAPYDKANLMPIRGERVATSRQGDATARFLEEAFAFQFSYTAWDEGDGDSAEAPAPTDAPMLHGKGVTIVVPDDMWPPDNDAQWVWSREDMKVHSTWTDGRRRDQLAPRMDTVGSLRVKDVFPPGSLIAVPVSELRKRDADCDGDKVFVYAGLPKLAQAVERHFDDRERRAGKALSLKPAKTASAALAADGDYQAGRAAEILSALQGQELVGRFSTLHFQFTGQPLAVRDRLAERALFGIYEGTDPELRRGVRTLLADPRQAQAPLAEALLQRARRGVEQAKHPLAVEVAALLQRHLEEVLRGIDSSLVPTSASPTAPIATEPPPLSDALAQRFAPLASAYAAATHASQRLQALVTHYPKALLSPPEPDPASEPALAPPDRPAASTSGTQSGYVPGAPMETLNNLLAQGVKVGTDAPKAVTQTERFAKVANRLDETLLSEPERTRLIPYTKGGVVQELRGGRFHAEANLARLRDNPTMAAGLMEMAIGELRAQGFIEARPSGHTPAREVEAQLRQVARSLHTRAEQAEPGVTRLVTAAAASGHGELRGQAQRIKTPPALQDKLRLLMLKGLPADQAADAVNDALRYSVVLAPTRFADGYAEVLGHLDRAGATKMRVHNAFLPQASAFKGINVKFTSNDEPGQPMPFEVQFHTEETFALKTRFHDAYKEESALRARGASLEERYAQLKDAYQAFKTVGTPPGCERIDDWDANPLRLERRAMPVVPPTGMRTQSAMAVRIKQLLDDAQAARREVEPMLEALALPVVPEHSVAKKPRSIEKKIERLMVMEQLSLEDAAARVRDAMRWVIQLPDERFGADVERALLDLRDKGLRTMRVNNGFITRDTTYAGLNVKLRTAGGVDFEIQFHTRDSLRMRHRTHGLYRRWQDTEVQRLRTLDPQERQALERANTERLAELRAMAAGVPIPAGAHTIRPLRVASTLTASGSGPSRT